MTDRDDLFPRWTALFVAILPVVIGAAPTSGPPMTIGRAAIGFDAPDGSVRVALDVECPADATSCSFSGPIEEGFVSAGAPAPIFLPPRASQNPPSPALALITVVLAALLLALIAGMVAYFFSGLSEPPEMPDMPANKEEGDALSRRRRTSSASSTTTALGLGAGSGLREKKGSAGSLRGES